MKTYHYNELSEGMKAFYNEIVDGGESIQLVQEGEGSLFILLQKDLENPDFIDTGLSQQRYQTHHRPTDKISSKVDRLIEVRKTIKTGCNLPFIN